MSESLQSLLNREIPLTSAIGIEIAQQGELSLSLRAPLANNINHKSTAFGGSLYSVSVLTGWGLIHNMLQANNLTGHIVIQQSQCDFILPVNSDLISHCTFESSQQVERFIKTYQRHGRARLKLDVTIQQENTVAMRFNGSYVIHR